MAKPKEQSPQEKQKEVIFKYARKILLIRIDRLGDVLLSTPLIKAIKENWHDKTLDVMVTPYTAEVFKGCSYVDNVKIFSHKWGIMERLKFLNSLKDENYDVVIAHSPNTMSYLIAYFTKALHRIGYTYDTRPLTMKAVEYLLTDPIILNLQEMIQQEQKVPHEVEQSFLLADKLGIKVKSREICLDLDGPSKNFAANQFTKWRWDGKKDIFGIHISNKWLSLGWEAAHLYRLVEELQKTWKGSCVVFTYGSQEMDIGREVEANYATKQRNPCVACIWDASLREWAAIIKKCSYFISMDTGAVHVAASQKVPVIAIYNPVSYDLDSQQWAPWRVKHKKLCHKAPVKLTNEIIEAIQNLQTIY